VLETVMAGLKGHDQMVLFEKRRAGVKRPPGEVIGLWGITH
jgi:hypothetical protein